MSVSFRPLLLLTILLAACSTPKSSSESGDGAGDNTITTILASPGHYSEELQTRMTLVVNSDDELAELWRQIHAGQSPVPPVPEVDFARESVVLATSGTQSSGGYSVTIESLEEIPEGMRLVILAESPGGSCMTTQALTTPIHVVRTRKLPAVVLFEWREEVVECE